MNGNEKSNIEKPDYSNITFKAVFGSIEMYQLCPPNGYFVTIWRDESGIITKQTREPAPCRLVYYEEPYKRWWEVWK